MVFSTNQNRQLYVATAVDANLDTLGDVAVKTDAEGGKYIIQKGHGGLVRSDIIPVGSVMWANVSGPEDTAIKLKAYEIDFASDGVDSTTTANTANAKPVSGQDYILRINFTQMYGMSDEDIYQKFGAVHATASMKKYDFFKAMAYSLVKNFSRLYQPLVQIAIGTAIDSTSHYKVIDRVSKEEDGTIHLWQADGTEISYTSGTDNTKLYILEKSQVDEWALGTKQYTPVYFKPFTTTIQNGVNEVTWGKVTDVTSTYAQTVGNGYKFADLEYFCMGERADQYRNIGWPNAIHTKYMVDPTKTYFSIDIHYAYQGDNHAIQKSEKTMTIIVPVLTNEADARSVVNSIVTGLGLADSYKIKATDLYDGTADGGSVYPTSGYAVGKL